MKYNFYTIKDELEQRYMSPMLYSGDDMAQRQFKSNLEHIDLWKDNPQDFTLICVGSFDDSTGEILSESREIINGRSLYHGTK